MHSHSVIFVLSSAVKTILTQQEVAVNNRASRVAKVQEFNLEIKATKLVRGQGLCKLMAKNQEVQTLPNYLFVATTDTWFSNVVFFLTYEEPPGHLSAKEGRNLRLKVAKYVIVDSVLYKRGLDGMFLRCVDKEQQQRLL